MNVHYDFQNDSRWTPFVGAGTGMARTKFRYGRHLLRKSIAQGYQDVDPPLTIADRPAAAASTLSLLDKRGRWRRRRLSGLGRRGLRPRGTDVAGL